LSLLLVACAPRQDWALSDVRGHLPDLAFNLTADDGKPVDAHDYRGKVVLLYFGYTHCPDVCPLALTHLHVVMQHLGAAAADARILFVSVDPARDTPAALRRYVRAFDSHAVGLSGPVEAISALTKRYRVVFDRGTPSADGSYEVNHSSVVFVFDRQGRARVLSTSADAIDGITHDVARILKERP
jgi:protein SCO1/2